MQADVSTELRSCRAQELGRSHAQENARQKKVSDRLIKQSELNADRKGTCEGDSVVATLNAVH